MVKALPGAGNIISIVPKWFQISQRKALRFPRGFHSAFFQHIKTVDCLETKLLGAWQAFEIFVIGAKFEALNGAFTQQFFRQDVRMPVQQGGNAVVLKAFLHSQPFEPQYVIWE